MQAHWKMLDDKHRKESARILLQIFKLKGGTVEELKESLEK